MAADTPSDNNIALRSVIMDRLVNGKDNGTALLYCLGTWMAPLKPSAAEITSPFGPLGDLVGEVGNGGLNQYFFNSGGNDGKRVIEALDIIEDKEGKALFQSAINVFGERGPAEDRALRQTQLDGLTAKQNSQLNQQDHLWYGHEKALGDYLKKWVRKNEAALQILPRSEVKYISFTGVAMSVDKSDWVTPLGDMFEKSPRNRGCGKSASGEFFDLMVVHSCLMKSRDEMEIIAVQAQDPTLKTMLNSLAPVAAGVHLRCIVVGANANLGEHTKADWLIAIKGTEKADLELVKTWLGNRLFEKDP